MKLNFFFLFFFLLGFTGLIFFLLKVRKSELKKNLLLTAVEVRRSIDAGAKELGLTQNELLFGVVQDNNFNEASFVFKNAQNQIVGTTIYPAVKRKLKMQVENETYVIEFPLTMNRTAILRKGEGQEILAKYSSTGWFGKHEFDIPAFGKIFGQKPKLDLKATYHYLLNDKVIGIGQKISLQRESGRIVLLPSTLPLEVRLFILSV